MSTYAQASDVQAIYGKTLSTEETAAVVRRLEQVERMIRRRIPDLAGQIEDGDLSVDDVIDVEAEAVLRVIRNPDGLRAETDGTYGYQLSAETADNTLRITAEEWAVLGVKSRGMFSITPSIRMPQ